MLQQGGNLLAAKDCFERAAAGHVAQRSVWHAAKAMDKAAEAARDARNWADLRACSARAAELYLEEGRPSAAAESVAKAALALEEVDPAAATKLYLQAVEWLEDSGKDALAGDTYRQAVSHLLRAQQWADAVGMLLRFAVSCQASGARSSQCKAYLGAVVTWLHGGNGAQAWVVYQDALTVDAFMTSDEAFAAEALLSACRVGDAEAVAAAVKKHHVFLHLDNQVAKLAKKLPQAELAKLAAQLGGQQAASFEDEGEEDLT